MNAEYIRLCSIPAVQEKIGERMGEWKVGDHCVDPDGDHGIVTSIMGTRKQWIEIHLDSGQDMQANMEMENLFRLPQVHDWKNPERGLWGMVDWELFSTLTPTDGLWYIFGMPDRRTKDFCSEWQTPELALIKALMWQWGIEE